MNTFANVMLIFAGTCIVHTFAIVMFNFTCTCIVTTSSSVDLPPRFASTFATALRVAGYAVGAWPFARLCGAAAWGDARCPAHALWPALLGRATAGAETALRRLNGTAPEACAHALAAAARTRPASG